MAKRTQTKKESPAETAKEAVATDAAVTPASNQEASEAASPEENASDAPKAAPDVSITPVVVDTVVESQEKDVLCRGLKHHSCTINKSVYNISKDQEVKLPNSVATILSAAGVVIKR